MKAQETPNIGAEIPYRRNQIDKPTGSLVFDQHLHEKLAETPEKDMPKGEKSLEQKQAG